MTGKDAKGSYASDKGKWWVKGDRLCRKWTMWPVAEGCFRVILDGDKLKLWRADRSDSNPKYILSFTK